mgnify:CR=1 FL=1
MVQSTAPLARTPAAANRVFETTLREIIWETPDTVTLILDPGDHPRTYKAGQYISIDVQQFRELKQQVAYFEHVKGRREAPRAYSLTSTPDEPYLAITIKEETFEPGQTEYPPLLSPFLVFGVREGMKITAKGYTGYYVLPDDVEDRTDHIVHIVAGSGVVPNFAILKWALVHKPMLRHSFVYSNRTWGDVIFAKQLLELERKHPDKLKIYHCLTRESEPPAEAPDAKLGRVDRELLASIITDPNDCLVYACGPGLSRWDKRAARERGEEPKPRFLESVRAILNELEVPRRAIHTEAYG